MNWATGVLIGVDQLGNSIAGGNPDSTISARVGYFANKETCSFKERCIKYYWIVLEWVINLAFLPVDGPDHCLQAYKNDSEEKFIRGSDLARVILSIFIFILCPIIFIVLHLAILIVPKWKNESE